MGAQLGIQKNSNLKGNSALWGWYSKLTGIVYSLIIAVECICAGVSKTFEVDVRVNQYKGLCEAVLITTPQKADTEKLSFYVLEGLKIMDGRSLVMMTDKLGQPPILASVIIKTIIFLLKLC